MLRVAELERQRNTAQSAMSHIKNFHQTMKREYEIAFERNEELSFARHAQDRQEIERIRFISCGVKRLAH